MKNLALLGVAALLLTGAPALAQMQPTQAQTDQMRRQGPCRDPWISWAYVDASSGTEDAKGFSDAAQCNPRWYNNGSWSSYTELYNAVKDYRNSLYNAGLSWQRMVQPNGTIAFFVAIDGVKYGAIGRGMVLQGGKLLGTDSGGLVGNDGASMVAAGGGNMVAAGGGNMVAAGGGNFQLQAGETRRIKVGRSTYMVIRR